MEIRKQIQDVVRSLPEELLPKVLEYMHQVEREHEREKEKNGKWNLLRHYKRVVAEDKDLLKML
jgi:hypothetical protein